MTSAKNQNQRASTMFSFVMSDIGALWDEETVSLLLGVSPHDVRVDFLLEDVVKAGDNTKKAKLTFGNKTDMNRIVMAYQGLAVPMTHGYHHFSFFHADGSDGDGVGNQIVYDDTSVSPPLHLQFMALPTEELERRLNQLGRAVSTADHINFRRKKGNRMCKVHKHASLAYNLAQRMGNGRQTKQCLGVPVPHGSVDDLLERLRSSVDAPWPPPEKQRRGVSAGNYLTVRKQHPPGHDEIWILCERLIRAVIPGAVYNCLAITRGFRGSPHVDNHDKTFQHVIAFGDFEGGRLCTETDEDGKEVVAVDVKCRFGRIDGRAVHWVSGWEGERYSVVYYSTSDEDYTEKVPQSVHTRWMESVRCGIEGTKSGRVPQRNYAPIDSRLPRKTPLLGLGCSSFSSFFSSQDEETLTVDTISREHVAVRGWIETIRHAVLDHGINLLDTAPWYGHGMSEITLGYAFDTILTDDDYEKNDVEKNLTFPKLQKRKRTGSLPRSNLIINTKAGRYESDPLHQFDFSYDTTMQSVHRSLERMNCGYINVIQLHDPEFAPSFNLLKEETIPALLECRRRGWAKAIGMTGYPLEVQYRLLVECQGLFGDGVVFDQSLVYCHNNLHDMSLFRDFCFPSLDVESKVKETNGGAKSITMNYEQFCRKSKIHLIAAAPLSMGLLTTAGPPSWHPAASSLKEACGTAAKMCESKGVDISSLALLYSLSQREVGCTLLGMKDIEQVDGAVDLAMRFCDINFDANENDNEANNHHRHYGINRILERVLTQKEIEALTLLLDETRGPFATVISNGEYRWDGKEEAKKFLTLVEELKSGKAKNDEKEEPQV